MTFVNSDDRARLEVKTVALDWYRDSSGRDRTAVDGMSVGSVLSCILWQGMSAIKHYASLYGTTETDDVIRLPSDASRMRQFVAGHFSQVVCDMPPTGELHLDEQFIKPEMLAVPRSAAIIRRLQRLFRPFIRRRRHLYITDWVTARSSRRDPKGLVLYRRSIVKSAIPACDRSDLIYGESLFPQSLEGVFSLERLNECLARNGYSWTQAECALTYKYALSIYQEVRPYLVRAVAQYRNMLHFYRPSRVFLPADAFEPWIICYHLCRKSSIETNMYVDGYMPVPLWPAIRDESGEDWLVDRVAAYGSAQFAHIEAVGFPPERVDLVRPPFLEYLDDKVSNSSEFDVIVLTWIPYTVNPSADYSSPILTLETVLKTVRDAGLRNIAVKVKSVIECEYVNRVAETIGMEITILHGRFYEHVRRAPLIIGGVSTAIAEAVAVGTPYVVFEPYGNGYTDAMISESAVMSRHSISRDRGELFAAISERRTSWIGDVQETLFA